MNSVNLKIKLICLIVWAAISLHARTIQGISTMTLNTPVTKKISTQAHAIAKDSLKADILRWMKSNGNTMLDTTNPVIAFHINSLMLSALSLATKETRFEQRDWILALSIPEEKMQETLDAYVSKCDNLAQKFWNEALQFNKPETRLSFFNTGLKSLFYNIGCFGGCLNMPVEAATKEIQLLIDKLSIKTDEMVISGKPGYKATQAPTITVLLDSIPFSELQIIGNLPGGESIFTLQTGPEGNVYLGEMRIPYVARGTFLHIHPNYGAAIGVPIAFDAVDLGLKAGSNKELTVIFNITPPIYSLKYKVNAASNIEIPEHFSGSRYLEKYLQDSCYMKPQANEDIADLVLEILCQISMSSSDETEEVYVKVEGKFIISPLKDGKRIEKDLIVYSKAFEANRDIPFGLFFWESASALKQKVKELISNL